MSFSDPVVVIGHRGAAGLVAENTLASFRRACACGVSAVELDVHLLEGELIVIHDDTLERTTSGRGALAAASLAGVRELDAGGGQRVPLLREVVNELPAGTGLNVELKGPGTALPVARFLEDRPDLDVLISSFDHTQLHDFRRIDPRTRVAPLFSRWRGSAWQTADALHAWAINLSLRAATPARLTAAAARGLKTFVYTVNDLAEARALVERGATGVFTDFPDRISRGALGGRARDSDGSVRP